jgi:YD repeat-containing protein
VSSTDANGFETQYEFDEKGQLTQVNAPEGHTKSYSYNALGQLTFEVHSGGYRVAYTYDVRGRILTQIKDPLGAKQTTTYNYDGIGRQLVISDYYSKEIYL